MATCTRAIFITGKKLVSFRSFSPPMWALSKQKHKKGGVYKGGAPHMQVAVALAIVVQ
jgi:hypothetical protein